MAVVVTRVADASNATS